jgi:hypothetical protein
LAQGCVLEVSGCKYLYLGVRDVDLDFVAILELYPDFSVSRSEKYFSGRISPENRQRTKVFALREISNEHGSAG